MYYKHALKSKASIYTEPFILKGAKRALQTYVHRGTFALTGRQGINPPLPYFFQQTREEHMVPTAAGL